MDGRENELPDSRLPTDRRYYEPEDQQSNTAPNAACLDFSVAKYLTAYRWSGERDLAEDLLVFVSA